MSLQDQGAWLEQGDFEHRIEGDCSIGRAALNIESHRGTVNKYLGEEILAYWRDEPQTVRKLSQQLVL